MGLRRFLRKRDWELLARVEAPNLITLKYLKKIKESKQNNKDIELDFFNFL